jgi:hypothetical protein
LAEGALDAIEIVQRPKSSGNVQTQQRIDPGANVFIQVDFNVSASAGIAARSRMRPKPATTVARTSLRGSFFRNSASRRSPHDFERGHSSTAACRSFGLRCPATGSERELMQGSDASFGFPDGESLRQSGSCRIEYFPGNRGFLDLIVV